MMMTIYHRAFHATHSLAQNTVKHLGAIAVMWCNKLEMLIMSKK
jgi:hypothetical protein